MGFRVPSLDRHGYGTLGEAVVLFGSPRSKGEEERDQQASRDQQRIPTWGNGQDAMNTRGEGGRHYGRMQRGTGSYKESCP